jgi:leucine dehydrogenase
VAARLGRPLGELSVCIQGLGQIGLRLARLLAAEGCSLSGCDVDEGRVARAREETGLKPVPVDAVYDTEADELSPNAAGGVLSEATIPRLRCRAVVGAANDQLARDEDGDLLHARGVVYAPDYVVNAGGLISLLFETGQTDEAGVRRRTEAIGETLAGLLQRAHAEGRPPHRVADAIVEERLATARASGSPTPRRPSSLPGPDRRD